MHQSVSAKHRLHLCSLTVSRVDVDFSALHHEMDRTIDEAVDSIRAQLASVEGYVAAFAGTEYEALVEVSGYSKSMWLDSVVVQYVNYHVGSQCNIHHRPGAAMELATVESDVHSLVSHYNYEIG